MRTPYLHTAVVALDPGSDAAGPGAAITLALCGSWDHDPPCPLASHHTRVLDAGSTIRLRVLFATEPGQEADVRRLIDGALRGGAVEGPDGRTSRWTLVGSGRGEVDPSEVAHGARLALG